MSYEFYERCGICPDNVGHYCDECEIRMDHVLYEAEKLKVDCDHLNKENEILRKQIRLDLVYPDEDKIKADYLKAKMRLVRESILRNKLEIQSLKENIERISDVDELLKTCHEKINVMESIRDSLIDYNHVDLEVVTGVNLSDDL